MVLCFVAEPLLWAGFEVSAALVFVPLFLLIVGGFAHPLGAFVQFLLTSVVAPWVRALPSLPVRCFGLTGLLRIPLLGGPFTLRYAVAGGLVLRLPRPRYDWCEALSKRGRRTSASSAC